MHRYTCVCKHYLRIFNTGNDIQSSTYHFTHWHIVNQHFSSLWGIRFTGVTISTTWTNAETPSLNSRSAGHESSNAEAVNRSSLTDALPRSPSCCQVSGEDRGTENKRCSDYPGPVHTEQVDHVGLQRSITDLTSVVTCWCQNILHPASFLHHFTLVS